MTIRTQKRWATQMTIRTHKRCDYCMGRGTIGDLVCAPCLGFGWQWSDDVPPTLCTANAIPCGRGFNFCSGCGRRAEDIGGAHDQARTLKHVIPQAASEPANT